MAKKKKVNYVLAERKPAGKSMTAYPLDPYPVLDRMLAHHPDLAGARIAVAWRREWNPNRDGQVTLGKCKRATDLDKALAEWDFVVILNENAWLDLEPPQRDALVDHELSHACPDVADGEQRRDENGRACWRTRRHDLEEFRGVVERHGLWISDVEAFAGACRDARQLDGTLLFDREESGRG